MCVGSIYVRAKQCLLIVLEAACVTEFSVRRLWYVY
jgi:hypothetical protein